MQVLGIDECFTLSGAWVLEGWNTDGWEAAGQGWQAEARRSFKSYRKPVFGWFVSGL